MNALTPPEPDREQRDAAGLLEVLIRAGLILALVLLCLQVFAPFLHLMVWAVILAVSLYPLHQALARRVGGRQGLAATAIVVLGVVLIVAPAAVLLNSMGDSVHRLQPKIGDLTKASLAMVASIGGAILQFIAALIIAGIIMAFGRAGDRSGRAIFARLVGSERGAEFSHLAVTTIRAVAQGVIGVAFIQAIIVGVCLLVADVPWAGVLAGIVLVLGIAQVPAALVTLPVIAYIWASGDYGNVAAIAYTILLFMAGLADDVLKPLMLGRGVDAPMPVILLGALGGMAASGILGMFVGATLLALGYQIFMGWVAANPEGAGPTDGGNKAA